MKQLSLLLGSWLLSMSSIFGQQPLRTSLLSSPPVSLERPLRSHVASLDVEKTANCVDTLFYPYAKILQLGNGMNDLDALLLEQSFGDKLAQIYVNAGTFTITGAEVGVANAVGNGSPSSGINALVQVYSVDAQNNLTTLLGSGTVFVSNVYNDVQFKRLSFPQPITITGNYAIAISTTTVGGKLACVTGPQAMNVAYYEGLSRAYTSYQNFNQWTLVSAIWADGQGNPIDAEPMLHPIVSYSLNLSGTVSPTTACVGDLVTFTNTTADSTVLNRMTHAGIYRKYWGITTIDSTFAWSHSGLAADANLVMWNSNASWTYTTPNSYTPAVLFEGGFGTVCMDAVFYSVTINDCTPPPPPLDNCTISGLNSVCTNESITLVASATGGSWSATPAGIVTVVNGVVTAGSNTGTVTISYLGGSNCSNTPTHQVTVNDCTPPPPPLDNCTISGLNTVCTNESITLVASATGGSWSATPAGIVTVVNGVLTAGSNTGTVTISYLGGSNCSNTPTHQVTVNDCIPPPPPPPTVNCSITGANTVCKLDNITLIPSATGGVWISSNSAVASVNNGIVTGESAGTTTISYGGSPNCVGTASLVITVNECGNGGSQGVECSVVGLSSLCQGENITLVASASDGTWSVTPEGVVSVENGIVTGLGIGTAIVSYSGGSCSNTATHNVTVNKCDGNITTSIDDKDLTNITIAPNPTSDIFTISGLPQQSIITINDLNGKVLFVTHSNSTEIELSIGDFVSGVYFINVQSETINGVHKIVLNK